MQKYFELLSDDLDIDVFCFLDTDGRQFKKTTTITINGVKITQCSEPLEKCFLKFVGSNRPDFIGTQLLWSDPIVALSKKYEIPCYYFAHGLFEDICQLYLTNRCSYNSLSTCNFGDNCPNAVGLRRAQQKYQMCEKIFTNSFFTKSIFDRFFPSLSQSEKIDVLYPYVDVDKFVYKSKNDRTTKRRILAVNSNFTKGRDIIVSIAQHLTNYEFIVVNTKEQDKKYFKTSKNIRTLGVLTPDEMAEQYHNSDVVIIPTFMDETFSLVACEAILCGTPVVSSRKGNLPNLIIQGVSGFTVESPDVWDWSDVIQKAVSLNIDEKLVSQYRDSYNPENGVKILKKEFLINNTMKKEEKENNFNEKFLELFGVDWNDG